MEQRLGSCHRAGVASAPPPRRHPWTRACRSCPGVQSSPAVGWLAWIYVLVAPGRGARRAWCAAWSYWMGLSVPLETVAPVTPSPPTASSVGCPTSLLLVCPEGWSGVAQEIHQATPNKSLDSPSSFLLLGEATAAQPEKLFFQMSLSRPSLSIGCVSQVLDPAGGFVLFKPYPTA